MTDIQHIDVDSEEFEGTPRALREHVKKLQKALTDVSAERDGFRNQINESALGDVLAGFNNPERVKRDLLSDKVDPLDTEAVNKWLADNGNDYAKAQAPADPQETEPQAEFQQPDYGRLNAPASVGQPAGVDPAQIVNSAPTDLSPDKLRQWFLDRGI